MAEQRQSKPYMDLQSIVVLEGGHLNYFFILSTKYLFYNCTALGVLAQRLAPTECTHLVPCSCPFLVCRPVYPLLATSFVFFWPKHFPDTPLLYPPNFDARIVSYPTAEVSENKPRLASMVHHCSGGDLCRRQYWCAPSVVSCLETRAGPTKYNTKCLGA